MTEQETRLPRILCLHGGGTNASIFRAQCRVLSMQLKDSFRLVFGQGTYPCSPGPDVMSVYKDWGPFYSWIPPTSSATPASLSNTLQSIKQDMIEDNNSGAHGPWVGVLGFSQGAKVAASLLLLQQVMRDDPSMNFKFGVLLAGRGPLLQLHESVNINERLRVPTLHVHGLQDINIELHRRLFWDCCTFESAKILEWNGEHRVAVKSGDVRMLVDEILVMAEEMGERKEATRGDHHFIR